MEQIKLHVFQKPYSIMYEIALKKANLTADKVWFCGDSIGADINGAESVGCFLYGMKDKLMRSIHLHVLITIRL